MHWFEHVCRRGGCRIPTNIWGLAIGKNLQKDLLYPRKQVGKRYLKKGSIDQSRLETAASGQAIRQTKMLRQPSPIAKEIALTFRSYVARQLHFLAKDKKGLFLPTVFFLSYHQVFCLE